MTPNIIPYRKEFLAGLSGLGGGPTGLSIGGSVAKKTYIDDIFSTYLYEGNNSNIVVNNGLDLSGEGGLVWVKNRGSSSYGNFLFDTVRGTSKAISSNLTNNQFTESKGVHTFSEDGFTIGGSGGDAAFNSSGEKYVSWSFRKAPGFLDIQEYSDGSSNTSGSIGNPNFQVNHQLGSMPGMILIKNTSANASWFAWIKGQQGVLNSAGTLTGSGGLPIANVTDTYIKFAAGNGTFNDPHTYIAYLFAGGESTAATAASVDFGGDNSTAKSYQRIAGSNPASWRDFGTANFTFEMWVRPDGLTTNNYHKRIFSLGSSVSACISLEVQSDASAHFRYNDSVEVNSAANTVPIGQWTHIAVERESNTLRLYINGQVVSIDTSFTSTLDYSGSGNALWIGNLVDNGSGSWNGQISNFRIVKGTAVYTSSFRVPTEPLTNITNTILLTCNDPTNKNASTITPATKSGWGGETAKADSPFDDPSGFVFGDNGKENVIKCGTYRGNSSADFEVDVGWEPQMIMFKAIGGAYNWSLFDSMRGIVTEGNENYLYPNLTNSEYTAERISLTPTGFIVDSGAGVLINENNTEYAYVAIRRKDGYVSKVEAGTDIFGIVNGNGSADGPAFISGFPVDLGWRRMTTTGSGTDIDWVNYNRLLGDKYLRNNTTGTETTSSRSRWDLMTGFNHTDDANYKAWMFQRRGKSFEQVTYTGDDFRGRQIPHQLNGVPKMMWFKSTTAGYGWCVYHESQGATKYALVESDAAFSSAAVVRFNNTAPTATHFTVGEDGEVNAINQRYIAYLFGDCPGISKCGSYTGTGISNWQTTGFLPRLILVKRADGTGDWNLIYDCNWSGVKDKRMRLNKTNGQTDDDNWVNVSATGFDPGDPGSLGNSIINSNTHEYIYYAHS